MANLIDYISQANHNKACAQALATGGRFKDWAITAAFYAALHYVESGLESTGLQHSQKSCPDRVALHSHRESLVKTSFPACWRQYRNLHEACDNVRYLLINRSGNATSYYTQEEVNDFISVDLRRVQDVIERVAGRSLS